MHFSCLFEVFVVFLMFVRFVFGVGWFSYVLIAFNDFNGVGVIFLKICLN